MLDICQNKWFIASGQPNPAVIIMTSWLALMNPKCKHNDIVKIVMTEYPTNQYQNDLRRKVFLIGV
jgi:hypothetical protein